MLPSEYPIRLWSSIAVAVLSLGSTAAAYTVSLNGAGTSLLINVAEAANGSEEIEFMFPAALPYSYVSTNISVDGTAIADHDFSQSGFDVTVDHTMGTFAAGSQAISTGEIYFSTDENVSYVISGSYDAVDVNQATVGVEFFDSTLGSIVFECSAESIGPTFSENFTFGPSEGSCDTEIGTSTGVLLADHFYRYSYGFIIENSSETATATATGGISLSLTSLVPPYVVILNEFGQSWLNTAAGTSPPSAGQAEAIFPRAFLPHSNTSSVSAGSNSSTGDNDLTNTGFIFTFDHARGPNDGDHGVSGGQVHFRVNKSFENIVSYTIVGNYSVSDSEGKHAVLNAALYDETDSVYVFRSNQSSRATANENFTVGQEGGDYSNVLGGKQTGGLKEGHYYRFTYASVIAAYPGASTTGASASGSVSILFGSKPLGVPSLHWSGIALLCCALGLAGYRSKERS